jgi:hypothetical protein
MSTGRRARWIRYKHNLSNVSGSPSRGCAPYVGAGQVLVAIHEQLGLRDRRATIPGGELKTGQASPGPRLARQPSTPVCRPQTRDCRARFPPSARPSARGREVLGMKVRVVGSHARLSRLRRLGRQSLSKLTFVLGSLSHQDRLISGAVLVGVEQYEVAARGAFDPDGKGQVIIVILAEGRIVTAGRKPAIEHVYGKAPDTESVRRATDGTSPQAELLKGL